MGFRLRHPLRLLRSRKLAVLLIVSIGTYATLMTAVPQLSFTSPQDLAAWQARHPSLASIASSLGLHHAYWSPVFLASMLLLSLSTAVCSYDRTRVAAAYRRLQRGVPKSTVLRLVSAPSFSVSVATDDADVLNHVAVVCRRLGLRVSRVDAVLVARTKTLAAYGSALFHWSLVGLFFVASIGQMTKWEGQIGIPVGHGVTDGTESYGVMSRGPLATATPRTGYEIRVPSMETEHTADGVRRGHAPLVELREGGRVLARSAVYPNNPLVYRGLYIHRSNEWGLGMVAALETSAGIEVARRHFLFDFMTAGEDGRITIQTQLPPEIGATNVRLQLPLDRRAPSGYRADLPADPRIELTVTGSDTTSTNVLRRGDVIRFRGGQLTLRIADINRYARLLVVHDPSIPVVYALLVLAMVGSAVAVMMYPRVVLARVSDSGGAVDVLVLAKKMDTRFAQLVRDALNTALLSEEEG